MSIRRIGPILDWLVYRCARARKRALPISDQLNIGSAYMVAPGWINLDNSPSVWLSKHDSIRYILQKTKIIQDSAQERWPSDIVFHDVRHGLPWPDQSLRYIYTSHTLEHLSRRDGEYLLRECNRVLKSGGILRVVVPDLIFYAKRYVDAHTEANLNSEDKISATEEFLEIVGAKSGSITSSRNPHRWMYDSASLANFLSKVGFINVVEKHYREGQVPDLEILDTRPDDSLHMEAERS